MSTTLIVIFSVIGLFALISLILAINVVNQKTALVVERFGEFKKIMKPGLNWKTPWIEWASEPISLRLQELEVPVQTKTQDNVFVEILVAIQFLIKEDKIMEAHYKFTDPAGQIKSYVFDVVLAKVPKLELDKVFTEKDDIAKSIKETLTNTMSDYGYDIVNSLINNVRPDEKVVDAMNEINAQKRLKDAAREEGEGKKIKMVLEAEAEKESKILQGQGIAGQREAIAKGLKKSVEDLKGAVEGADAQTVMNTIMLTQHYDTMKEIGSHSGSTAIFLNPGPGGMNDIMTQMMAATKASKAQPGAKEPVASGAEEQQS